MSQWPSRRRLETRRMAFSKHVSGQILYTAWAVAHAEVVLQTYTASTRTRSRWTGRTGCSRILSGCSTAPPAWTTGGSAYSWTSSCASCRTLRTDELAGTHLVSCHVFMPPFLPLRRALHFGPAGSASYLAHDLRRSEHVTYSLIVAPLTPFSTFPAITFPPRPWKILAHAFSHNSRLADAAYALDLYDVPTSPGSLVLYFTSLCTSYPHYARIFRVHQPGSVFLASGIPLHRAPSRLATLIVP